MFKFLLSIALINSYCLVNSILVWNIHHSLKLAQLLIVYFHFEGYSEPHLVFRFSFDDARSSLGILIPRNFSKWRVVGKKPIFIKLYFEVGYFPLMQMVEILSENLNCWQLKCIYALIVLAVIIIRLQVTKHKRLWWLW